MAPDVYIRAEDFFKDATSNNTMEEVHKQMERDYDPIRESVLRTQEAERIAQLMHRIVGAVGDESLN